MLLLEWSERHPCMHECRKSYIINGKLKNNKIKKHTIATSFELLLLDRNYCSPISFCSKIQYLLLLSFVFSYYTLFIFIISMLMWFMVRRQQQPTKQKYLLFRKYCSVKCSCLIIAGSSTTTTTTTTTNDLRRSCSVPRDGARKDVRHGLVNIQVHCQKTK